MTVIQQLWQQNDVPLGDFRLESPPFHIPIT